MGRKERKEVFQISDNFFFPPHQKNSLPVCLRPQGGELHDLIGHYLSLLQFLSCHTVCFLTYAKRNNVGMHPFWLRQSLFLLSSLPQILSSYAISSIHFAVAHSTPQLQHTRQKSASPFPTYCCLFLVLCAPFSRSSETQLVCFAFCLWSG